MPIRHGRIAIFFFRCRRPLDSTILMMETSLLRADSKLTVSANIGLTLIFGLNAQSRQSEIRILEIILLIFVYEAFLSLHRFNPQRDGGFAPFVCRWRRRWFGGRFGRRGWFGCGRRGAGKSHAKLHDRRKDPIWYTAHMSTALKNEIKRFAQESVRKVLTTEMMRLRASLLSTVSQKEQRTIEKLYKKPSGKAVRSVRVRI